MAENIHGFQKGCFFFLNPFFCCGVMVFPTEITGFGCPFCRIFFH